MKFITLEHLQMLVDKIKELFEQKEDGKGLSANDLTNELKTNYDSAYTHSASAHAPPGAQENVVESIKVNGAALTVADKSVDVAVPAKISDLTNDSGFQTGSQVSASITTALAGYSSIDAMNTAIASAIAATGPLKREIVTELPAVSSADANAIYLVQKTNGKDSNVYTEYMVINGGWELIGDTAVDLTGYLKADDIQDAAQSDIDALFN